MAPPWLSVTTPCTEPRKSWAEAAGAGSEARESPEHHRAGRNPQPHHNPS